MEHNLQKASFDIHGQILPPFVISYHGHFKYIGSVLIREAGTRYKPHRSTGLLLLTTDNVIIITLHRVY